MLSLKQNSTLFYWSMYVCSNTHFEYLCYQYCINFHTKRTGSHKTVLTVKMFESKGKYLQNATTYTKTTSSSSSSVTCGSSYSGDQGVESNKVQFWGIWTSCKYLLAHAHLLAFSTSIKHCWEKKNVLFTPAHLSNGCSYLNIETLGAFETF